MSGAASSTRAVALAPAKINLFLELLARRPDGFHELDTWMLALDWCDRVTARATESPGVALELAGPAASADVPADERNLAWRAAERLLVALGEARGLALTLHKEIPSQSGLGGASSDAVATLLAAQRALGRNLPAAELADLAGKLGSDCAFFLGAAATGFAHCTGRGELVRPIALPAHPPSVLLLVPEVRCPTAAVYAAARFPLRGHRPLPTLPPSWFDVPTTAARALLFNRLESAAAEVAPELREWRVLFESLEAGHARLTGSGSAFFVLCSGRAEGADLERRCTLEARRRGLGLRASRVLEPAGHGAKVQEC